MLTNKNYPTVAKTKEYEDARLARIWSYRHTKLSLDMLGKMGECKILHVNLFSIDRNPTRSGRYTTRAWYEAVQRVDRIQKQSPIISRQKLAPALEFNHLNALHL